MQLAEQQGLTTSAIYGIERYQMCGCQAGTRMPRQFTKRDAEIVKRYKGGETLEELGLTFAISRERVRQILVRDGCFERHWGRAKREARMFTLVCPKCGKSRRIKPSRINRIKDAFCSLRCRALADPNNSGRRAYLMRRDEQLIWSEIGRRVGAMNACGRARKWAEMTGWDWPLVGYDGRKRRIVDEPDPNAAERPSNLADPDSGGKRVHGS